MSRDYIKNPPRFTTRFVASARAYQLSNAETKEVKASIERLRGLLPSDINPDDHPTILYIVGNLFVGGTLNKNDDAVSIEDTLRCYRSFEGQQINIEHNRGDIVGYIVRAGLSEFGTDRLITEDEARAAGQPVNVAIAVAIWKVVDKELARYILESSIPGSATKDSLSFSFEVGFDSYSVVVLPKGSINLATATTVVSPQDESFGAWDKRLRANKGSGSTREGNRIGRILDWPIVPMGGGIVAQPAGAVKGLVPVLGGDNIDSGDEDGTQESEAAIYKYASAQCTLSAEFAAPFIAYGESIPENHLYYTADPEKEGRYGREEEPHITVRYGLKGNSTVPVQLSLQGTTSIVATLGKITAFENEDKPYDVLKVDVVSEDLNRLNALIGASCDCNCDHPVYYPHLTLAYLKKGLAAQYVNDARFEGQKLVFSSVTFCPTEGDRTELWLEQPTIPPAPTNTPAPLSSVQTVVDLVYNPADPSDLGSSFAAMSQPTKTLKLSAGWQEKLAALQAAAGDGGLPHGIDVVLSDGRNIKGLKVVDAATLGTDIEYSYDGVVITSMTPGVPAPEYMPPGKEDVYPTTDIEARAEAERQLAQQKEAQNAGYIGASIKNLTAAIDVFSRLASVSTNSASAGVSNSTTPVSSPIMKLEDLKQAVAGVKSPEDLNQAVANVAAFVDILAKASEEQAAARASAEQAAKTAEANLVEVKAKLEQLSQSYNQLISAQQAAAAEQVFQTRMASVEEVFAFDDEARAEIVTEIKACADDTAFAAWMNRAKKMYKGYLKKDESKKESAKASDCGPDGMEKEDDDEEAEAKLKAAAKVALASAAAAVVDAPIHNSIAATPANKSLTEQYAEILRKGATIGGVAVGALEEASKKAKKTI